MQGAVVAQLRGWLRKLQEDGGAKRCPLARSVPGRLARPGSTKMYRRRPGGFDGRPATVMRIATGSRENSLLLSVSSHSTCRPRHDPVRVESWRITESGTEEEANESLQRARSTVAGRTAFRVSPRAESSLKEHRGRIGLSPKIDVTMASVATMAGPEHRRRAEQDGCDGSQREPKACRPREGVVRITTRATSVLFGHAAEWKPSKRVVAIT